MNRASNELRKVFVNLYNEGIKSDKIAKTIGLTGRTVRYWIKLIKNEGETRLFQTFESVSQKSKLDLQALKKEFETNKTAFNREIASKFNCSTATIERYRHKWHYTKKKGRTKYKEADEKLKKST
jgi:transposase